MTVLNIQHSGRQAFHVRRVELAWFLGSSVREMMVEYSIGVWFVEQERGAASVDGVEGGRAGGADGAGLGNSQPRAILKIDASGVQFWG